MQETSLTFSSKISYLLGVGTVLALGFAAGFFILLPKVLNQNAPEPVAVAAVAPSDSDQPEQESRIQLAPVTRSDWIRGNPDAPITIVEYSDLECPFCKRFHPTMQKLITEYDGAVRWVYRHFPLSSLHQKAQREAEATECAGELGGNEGFWAYVDRLFEVTPSNDGLEDSELPQIAQDIGLDRKKFQQCLDSGTYARKVQEQYNQAIAAGGRGTPHSLVITADGELIPVQGAIPYEQLKSIVDGAL